MCMEGLRRSEKKTMQVSVGNEAIWTLAQSDLSCAVWVKIKRGGGRKASLQSYVQGLGFLLLLCFCFETGSPISSNSDVAMLVLNS